MSHRAAMLSLALVLLAESTRKTAGARFVIIDELGELEDNMVKDLLAAEKERRYSTVSDPDEIVCQTHYDIPRDPPQFGSKRGHLKKFQSMKAKSR